MHCDAASRQRCQPACILPCPRLPPGSNSPERERPGLPLPHKRRGRSSSPSKRHGHGHSSSGAESSQRGSGMFRTRSSASSASASTAAGERHDSSVAAVVGSAPACVPAAARPGKPLRCHTTSFRLPPSTTLRTWPFHRPWRAAGSAGGGPHFAATAARRLAASDAGGTGQVWLAVAPLQFHWPAIAAVVLQVATCSTAFSRCGQPHSLPTCAKTRVCLPALSLCTAGCTRSPAAASPTPLMRCTQPATAPACGAGRGRSRGSSLRQRGLPRCSDPQAPSAAAGTASTDRRVACRGQASLLPIVHV